MSYSDIVEPPDPHDAPWLTLAQAAFIMQKKPQTLLRWIRKGLINYNKLWAHNLETGEGIMIHQSEMDRFRYPWRHIWRIDDRINCLHILVEKLKAKINGGEDAPAQIRKHGTDILNLERRTIQEEYQREKVQKRVDALDERLDKLKELNPEFLNVLDVRLQEVEQKVECIIQVLDRLTEKKPKVRALYKFIFGEKE